VRGRSLHLPGEAGMTYFRENVSFSTTFAVICYIEHLLDKSM
jgi:hypothetical protein